MPTLWHQHTQRSMGDVFRHRAIGAVTGAAGLGKTFSVDTFLATMDPLQHCKVLFPQNATPVTVARRLFRYFYGDEAPMRASQYRLAELLETELAGTSRLLVIDEAQNLNRPCFEFLRILHDQPTTNFGLVFVGGDGARQVLAREPMLSSRIYRPVAFEPLTPPTLFDAVRCFHPLLAELDDAVIRDIDDTVGHGNFRHWASFTHTTAELCREHERAIDREVIDNAFALLRGAVRLG